MEEYFLEGLRVDYWLRRVEEPIEAAPVAGGALPPTDLPLSAPAPKRHASEQRKAQLSARDDPTELPINWEKGTGTVELKPNESLQPVEICKPVD